jgi:hypothetical protein
MPAGHAGQHPVAGYAGGKTDRCGPVGLKSMGFALKDQEPIKPGQEPFRRAKTFLSACSSSGFNSVASTLSDHDIRRNLHAVEQIQPLMPIFGIHNVCDAQAVEQNSGNFAAGFVVVNDQYLGHVVFPCRLSPIGS